MPFFPKITRPCPVADDLASHMKGQHCTLCKKDVHDLTHMSDQERRVFLGQCQGEVCISYSMPAKAVFAAAALAASGALSGVAAEEYIVLNADQIDLDAEANYHAQVEAYEEATRVIVAGGFVPKPEQPQITDYPPPAAPGGVNADDYPLLEGEEPVDFDPKSVDVGDIAPIQTS